MHYKNGRAAKVGDRVVVPAWNGKFIGVVVDATPGSTTCNLQVLPVPVTGAQSATAGECLHVDDALRTDGEVPDGRPQPTPLGIPDGTSGVDGSDAPVSPGLTEPDKSVAP